MVEAIREAADSVPSGHIVIVSHQLPIWMVHRRINRLTLWHNPSRRRCSLSSITSFRVDATEAGGFELVEVDYQEPRGSHRARDLGAV